MTGPDQTGWTKFKKCHEKKITLRKTDKLDGGRSHMANGNVMAQHFNLLKKIIANLGLGIIKKARLIFNCKESGTQLDAKTGKKTLSTPFKIFSFIYIYIYIYIIYI